MVLARNPVHSALLPGDACSSRSRCCSCIQDAQLLAAVQVIVYAGAIVVLFLFVIMLLGVDRSESLARPGAVAAARRDRARRHRSPAVLIVLGWRPLGHRRHTSTRGVLEPAGGGNVEGGRREPLHHFLWPFELTAVLLVIAVVGGVVLARRIAPAAPTKSSSELEEQDAA